MVDKERYYKTGHKGIILLILLLVIALWGCNQQKSEKVKPVITVSILPYKFFVEKIAGDHFDIEVMIPPGASPATFEPMPRQVLNLNQSEVYLLSGFLAFEINWINKVSSNLHDLKLIDTSDGLNFIINDEPQNHDDDHQHRAIEPHIWTSPKNVKIIAKNIANTISEIDPEHADFYKDNLLKFENEIDSIDQLIQDKLKVPTNRAFIIYHPALSYFSRDYNLIQVSIEQQGKEPSVKHIQQIVQVAHEKNIKVILVQKQFNMDEAKTLEKEIQGKIIIINPLAYNWTEEMLNISRLLANNL